MRHIALLATLTALLTACSSTPERAKEGAPADQKAAAHTDSCLDNPELAKSWGECNVKQTMFEASPQLEKCRRASPAAKGTVSFELKLRASGTVKSVKDLGGKHGAHTACVAKVLRKLKFAAPGKPATITVPYQLEP